MTAGRRQEAPSPLLEPAPRRKIRFIYATTPYAVGSPDPSRPAGELSTTVHGKELGTNRTLCGEPTFTWFKFLDVPFRRVLSNRCPGCVDAMGRTAARTAIHAGGAF